MSIAHFACEMTARAGMPEKLAGMHVGHHGRARKREERKLNSVGGGIKQGGGQGVQGGARSTFSCTVDTPWTGAVGVSSVKDQGSVKILSEGKVRAGMCFYKVNDTVVTDMDQALALVKARPAKLLFVDIGKLRRRRRKDRRKRSSNLGSETEDTDPFPDRPPEGQHDFHGVSDDPSGSGDGEGSVALAARGRQMRPAPVAELVKAEREGCFTWEVVLTKASSSDKFGFVQASGRMDFEQRLQRRSRERTGDGAAARGSRGQSSDEGASSDVTQDSGVPPGPQMLIVRRIHEGGLLDKWNKENPNAHVQVRDRIANVNGHSHASAFELSTHLSSLDRVVELGDWPCMLLCQR